MGFSKQDSVALSSESSIAYSGGITNTNSTLFDGSNDYMVCGNSATLNPADITIVAWIKPDALTSWDYLVLRGTADYDKAYRFEVGATQLFCAFGDGGTENVSIIATHGMSNGNWYHVAVTFDGSNAALYVDGASIGTASISIVMDTDVQTTYICNSVGTQPHFDGRVDEVAIFSSALSAADILAIYNAGTPTDLTGYSPAAWWRMGDSNSGYRIDDEVATDDNALYLPAISGNRATIPDAADLDGWGNFTFEVTLAADDWTPSVKRAFLSKYHSSSDDRSYSFELLATGFLRLIWSKDGEGGEVKDSTANLSAYANGTELTVRVVRTGTSLVFSVDSGSGFAQLGDPVSTIADAVYAGPEDVVVGMTDRTDSRWKGNISRARIWSDATQTTNVLDVNFAMASRGATSFTATSGQTVTIDTTDIANQAAIRKNTDGILTNGASFSTDTPLP